MAHARPLPLSPASRAVLAALPFALAATIPLLFDVLRDIPPGGCGIPAAAAAVLAAYRFGALPLHLGVIAVALIAIAAAGDRRGRGPLGLGVPTLALLVPTLLMAAAFAATVAFDPGDNEWLALPLLPFIFTAALLPPLAAPLGPDVTGLLAALTLAGIAAAIWMAVAHDGRTAWPRAGLWTIVLLTGGHLLLVYTQGTGGIGC